MEEILKQLLEGQSQILKRLESVELGQTELKQSLARIEQEQGRKISALFDAREIRC